MFKQFVIEANNIGIIVVFPHPPKHPTAAITRKQLQNNNCIIDLINLFDFS